MLVIALFVIVVLALLGLTMTRLLSSSSQAVVYEVLGQRAANAARTGIECALAAEFGSGCTQYPYHEFSGVQGLEDCYFRVAETSSKTVTDSSQTFTYKAFTSTGQCTAGTINATRYLYVDVMQ